MAIDSISPISANNTPGNSLYGAYSQSPAPSTDAKTSGELSPEEQQEVQELKDRDAEVRRHEQAHITAGGKYVRSGPHYEYTTGPDGQRYAVGGEVELDISPIPNEPEATITKAEVVKNAALAPEKPSAQDYRVASSADKMALDARGELAEQQAAEKQSGYDKTGQPAEPPSTSRIFNVAI